MTKKIFLLSMLFSFIAAFSIQSAMAYNSNWKVNQEKMLEQIKLKPGDVIDKSNWEKVQELLPESIVGYVKKGEFVLNIGELKCDFSADEEWDKASKTNMGKYGLGKKNEIVERATGRFPKYIYGNPFPDIDMNDPRAGAQIMHNKSVQEGRTGNQDEYSTTIFISEGGVDRVNLNHVQYLFFWARPDGEQPNPNNYKYTDLIILKEPYDLAGTVILTQRTLDGSTDLSGTYVPALRRVRRTSGATRSDPFFGSDFVTDDTRGWGGQNETMNWRVVASEKVILLPFPTWQANSLEVMVKQPNGSWLSKGNNQVRFGADDPNWKGVPWAFLDVVWVPRKVCIIEATPLDPYYNYGKSQYYIDIDSMATFYKITDNKAGEHWKTLLLQPYMPIWGDDKKRTMPDPMVYVCVDDRAHHASGTHALGHWRQWDIPFVIMDPNIKPEMFTFEKMATLSK